MRTADPHAPTKEKILDAATKLMLAKGFTATSIEEILTGSGATKGSFFHFFKSKEALGKALVDRFHGSQMKMFDAAPFRKDPDSYQRVLGWIDTVIATFNDPDKPKSCLIGNFTQELAPTHPEMRELCAEKLTHMAKAFAADVKLALKSRPAVKSVDPDALAHLFIAIIHGSIIVIKAKRDVSIGVENMRQFRAHVENLFNNRRPAG